MWNLLGGQTTYNFQQLFGLSINLLITYLLFEL